MNVVILNWRDIKNEWAGGGEVYVFELAKRWVKMGHKVTLICGQDIRKNLPAYEKIDGIEVFRRGGRYGLYFWAAWIYLRKFRASCDFLIDVQNGIPFFSVLYSRKPKLSVVYHVHGRQFFVELPFPVSVIGFTIERYIFPWFYKNIKVIAISQTTKEALIKIGFLDKNIHIIYCGMNVLKRNGSAQKKFSVPTLFYLGRIKKYKRVDLLVKIMPQILKKIPNAQLIIAGWGTEASMVTDMSMRSSVRRKVKILGPVSQAEKFKLLSRSWVFVNPSIGEGWGISVLEANQHGVPAVAFDVPGLSESIKNKKTGFLAKDEEDFVERVTTILSNSKLRKELGQNAIKHANSFDWNDAATKLNKIMTDEIRRKKASFIERFGSVPLFTYNRKRRN